MIWCIKTYTIAYVKTQKKRFIIHYDDNNENGNNENNDIPYGWQIWNKLQKTEQSANHVLISCDAFYVQPKRPSESKLTIVG